MRNTKISMMYASEGGREYSQSIFSGEISQKQWTQLIEAASTPEMEGFIPAQIGLPAPYDERIQESGVQGYDHVSTMFENDGADASDLLTDEPITDTRTIEQFVQDFVGQRWDIQAELDRCENGAYFKYAYKASAENAQDVEEKPSPITFDIVDEDGEHMEHEGRLLIDLSHDEAMNALSELHHSGEDIYYQANREVVLFRMADVPNAQTYRADPDDDAFCARSIREAISAGSMIMMDADEPWLDAIHLVKEIFSNEELHGAQPEIISVSVLWDLRLEKNVFWMTSDVMFNRSDVKDTAHLCAVIAVASSLQRTSDINPEMAANMISMQLSASENALPLFKDSGAAFKDTLMRKLNETPATSDIYACFKNASMIVKESTDQMNFGLNIEVKNQQNDAAPKINQVAASPVFKI